MSNFTYELNRALKGDGALELFKFISTNPQLVNLSEFEWFDLLDHLDHWLTESVLDRNSLLVFCQEWINALPQTYSYNLNIHDHNVQCLRVILTNWVSKYAPASIKKIEDASIIDYNTLIYQTPYYKKQVDRITSLFYQYMNALVAAGYDRETLYASLDRCQNVQLLETILTLHNSLYDSYSQQQVLQIAQHWPQVCYVQEIIKLCRALNKLDLNTQSIAHYMSSISYHDIANLGDTIQRFKERNHDALLQAISLKFQNSLFDLHATLKYYEFLLSLEYSTDRLIEMARKDSKDYQVQIQIQNLSISYSSNTVLTNSPPKAVDKNENSVGRNLDVQDQEINVKSKIMERLEIRKKAREEREKAKQQRLDLLMSSGFDVSQSTRIMEFMLGKGEDIKSLVAKCLRLYTLGYTPMQLFEVLQSEQGMNFLNDLLENSKRLMEFGIQPDGILAMLKYQSEHFSLKNLADLKEKQRLSQNGNRAQISHSQVLNANCAFFCTSTQDNQDKSISSFTPNF